MKNSKTQGSQQVALYRTVGYRPKPLPMTRMTLRLRLYRILMNLVKAGDRLFWRGA